MDKKAVTSQLILNAIAKRQKEIEMVRKPIFGAVNDKGAKKLSDKTTKQILNIYAPNFSKKKS